MKRARIAGLVALAGACATVTGTFMPWIEATDPSDAATLTRTGIDGHYGMLVAALAVISGAVSALLLAFRSTAAAVAIVLLSLLQLGIVIFVARNLYVGVGQLEAAGATAGLGGGLYLAGLGIFAVLVAGMVAWAGRNQGTSSNLPGGSKDSQTD